MKTIKTDIFDNGLMTPEVMGIPIEKAVSDFAMGKIAIIMGASWNFNDIEAINPDLNYAVYGVPNADGSSVYYLGDCLEPALAISKDSKNKEAAMAFLESLYTEDSLRDAEEIKGIIACVDGFDSSFLTDPRCGDAIANGMNKGFQFMPQTHWQRNVEEMRKHYVESMQSLCLGTITPEEAAAGFDEIYFRK